MLQAASIRRVWLTVLLSSVVGTACGSAFETPTAAPPVDVEERRRPALYDLVLTPDSRIEGLAYEEMRFEGPFVDDQGRQVITVLTTGHHAATLADQWGFELEGHRTRPVSTRAACSIQ